MIEYKYSPFDSEVLGVRAGNLVTELDVVERGALYKAMAIAASDCADFLHLRVDTRNLALVREAEDMGFRVMDTLLHVGCSLEELPIFITNPDIRIREAVEDDLAKLEFMTRDNMKFTRFHNDPNVTQDTADSFYVEWLRNVVLGRTAPENGVSCRVAIIDGEVVGYMTTLERGSVGRYGTMAVNHEHKRKGIASNLAFDALAQCKMRGCERLEGGALLRAPVLNVYMNLGLRHTRTEHSLHWWGRG